MFYSKGEATNFNADITNDVNFRPFNYKARLLENTVADGADGTIAVQLKYSSNFWSQLICH